MTSSKRLRNASERAHSTVNANDKSEISSSLRFLAGRMESEVVERQRNVAARIVGVVVSTLLLGIALTGNSPDN